MAIASRGGIGTAATSADAATIVLSVSSTTVSAGNFAILVIAGDNSTTTDGNNSEVTTVTDSGGNTWLAAREMTNGQGAASAGTVVSVWYSNPTTTLTAGAGGGTVTVTFASVRQAKAVTGWAFSKGNSTIKIAASTATATDSARIGTANLATTLTNQEYLFLRGDALEGDIATYTVTTGYTSLSWATALVGGTFSNFITTAGEFKIATSTSAMSTSTVGLNYDTSTVFVAFYESATGATIIYTLALTGVGG